jgi:hypothetical protein
LFPDRPDLDATVVTVLSSLAKSIFFVDEYVGSELTLFEIWPSVSPTIGGKRGNEERQRMSLLYEFEV